MSQQQGVNEDEYVLYSRPCVVFRIGLRNVGVDCHGWVTQRRKDRVRHTLRATSQREELYRSFIEEASRLYADALVNDKSEVSKLVDLYALIARMKILSSDAVIEAAEKAGRLILETYLSPNRTFVDLPELINEMDPLRDFSEACRRELQVISSRAEDSDHAVVSVFRVGGKLSSRGAVRRKLVVLRADCTCATLPTFRSIRRSTSGSIRIINGPNAWCLTPRVRRWHRRKTPTRETEPQAKRKTPVADGTPDPFEAFAEMGREPVEGCFRPPCFSRPECGIGRPADAQSRASSSSPAYRAARKGLTSPNPLHKPPGKS